MVNFDEKYNLNHLYNNRLANEVVDIGDNISFSTQEVELYKKSLVLTSDIKRLPLLRGFAGNWKIETGLGGGLQAAGQAQMTFTAWLINKKVDTDDDELSEEDLEHVLAEANGYVVQAASALSIVHLETIEDNLQGAVLLSPTITLVLRMNTGGNVAGTDLPKDLIQIDTIAEIDWVPITKAQMDDFIREHLFAEEE